MPREASKKSKYSKPPYHPSNKALLKEGFIVLEQMIHFKALAATGFGRGGVTIVPLLQGFFRGIEHHARQLSGINLAQHFCQGLTGCFSGSHHHQHTLTRRG